MSKRIYRFVEMNKTNSPVMGYNQLYVDAFVRAMNERKYYKLPQGFVATKMTSWVIARKEENMPEGALAVVYFTTDKQPIGILVEAGYRRPIHDFDKNEFIRDSLKLETLVKLDQTEVHPDMIVLNTHTARCGMGGDDCDAQGTEAPSQVAHLEALNLAVKYNFDCRWEGFEKGWGGFIFTKKFDWK